MLWKPLGRQLSKVAHGEYKKTESFDSVFFALYLKVWITFQLGRCVL